MDVMLGFWVLSVIKKRELESLDYKGWTDEIKNGFGNWNLGQIGYN